MMKETAVVVIFLHVSHCFAQSDGNLLIYNAHKNRCLGNNLQELEVCDLRNPRQQFRWTSENRIFNVAEKKCLGTGNKSEGSKLQWYQCDANSDLQKWECENNSLFGLKNETLYLSNSLVLSRDPGEKGKWTLHGTTDSICSRPYEEIYTLKGNSFGRPCHFPFLYKNTWYTNCTTGDRSFNLSWCSIESEYDPNQLWGYCPHQEIVQQLWRKNPLTDVYYQVNEDSALTWYQARKSCQQQGGDLLSITEPHEQTFISGLTQRTGPVLWTGLNSLDASRGWHWVGGQPFRYLKWMSGQPSSLPGYSCGVLDQSHDSGWSTAVCSERHGYICQRCLPTPTVPPVVHTGSCYSPWIPYSGHCYLLSRTKRTWLEAKDACRREGGDLLSILNVEEQSFTLSQLGYAKTDELWIGLNDLHTSMLFQWSDDSNVRFALWDVNEPSHKADPKENCVLMRGEEGKWADQICQNKYGFICKKKKHTDPSTNDTVITHPGCRPGWIRFDSYCYRAESETKTFEEAKEMCEKTGSYLADITNRIENAFLVSLTGAQSGHFWIGLSNQEDVHVFEWTNSNKVLFTHFNAGMPGGKHGCVGMTTGILAGLWDVLSCTNVEKYICKQKAEGVITTTTPPTTPTPKCSVGWNPVPDRDLCFKIFNPVTEAKKTWFEALDYCKEVGGDLLSIHGPSYFEEFQYSSTAWIGYSIQDPSVGFTWSDGSSSSYQSWQEGEPDNLNNMEKCAAVTYEYWRNSETGEWRDMQCGDRLDWLCEIQKGVTPKEVNITSKVYNTTEDGWIIFNGNQYYFYNDESVPMVEARSFCKHRHADLVVINDESERLFLWHQSKDKRPYSYIGMIVDLDKSISWMDGSPVVFQAWAENEPTFLYSEEQCVAMSWPHGLWESVNCGLKIKFICKRSEAVPAHATAAPTDPPTGGCADNWHKLQKQCFKIGLDLKTWDEATSYCRSLGGDLASITNSLQQAFLTLMMDDGGPDLWLGFNNLADKGFRWTNGSPVLYTTWRKGNTGGSCVAMEGGSNPDMGQWVKKDCNSKNGYICSAAIDQQITSSPKEMPKTFHHGNSSYILIQTNLTWKDAQSHCGSLGGNLASIRDAITQSYMTVQAHNFKHPLWIGLNLMETYGYFLWIDNWQLNLERWAPNEPKKDHPCVYVDIDGTWKTAMCHQIYYSVCKQSTGVVPTLPVQFPGVCPQEKEDKPRMIWMPYRGHCYAFVYGSESWYTASRTCMTKGADILSIVDPKESAFIANSLKIFGDDYSLFWIGLFKNKKGHWLWHDESVVDYLNWDENAEEFSGDHYESYDIGWSDGSDCAVISTSTGQWEKRRCRYTHIPFICKKAKVIKPTTEPTPTARAVTGVAHRSFSGVSVAVLIVGLCVLAGLSYGFYRTSRKQVSTCESPAEDTGEALLTENKDTKALVTQMEINEEAPAL
ncbi:macrophage mannose receptor 1-like [Astyanax mexicanus]|uniref:Macrophage mannose receptor 1-like n=1 Tax=Astyanax mexicanus TaxID=7994 RepID=A0A8T2LSX9_ASTMX|nr:macrophage mannose receptor 1-like [Astyanax mexicanus]